jgi:uncharacterized membrane protein YkoI
MLARNAMMLMVATLMTAAVATAQQPTSKAKSTATAQAPGAKTAAKTAAAKALPVSSDSAKKIVMANAAGATVSSARLHRSSGKAWYAVSYKVKGEKQTMHATVDANSGQFATVAPAAPKTPTKKPAK